MAEGEIRRVRKLWHRLRNRVAKVRERVGVLRLALRDSRTPWYARVAILAVLAYALSPVDLIPDWIPLLGLLDDLLLLPLGIMLAWRLIPRRVREECTEEYARRRAPRQEG